MAEKIVAAGGRWSLVTGWTAVATLAAGGALLAGGGVFAAWTSTANAAGGTNEATNVGMAHVDTNGTTFSTGVANLLPGDYVYRYANLTNTGSASEVFTATAAGTGVLAGAGGLQFAVDTCPAAWASDGTCSGTVAVVAATTDVAGATPVSLGTVAANGVRYLRYKVQLNGTADQSTFQGKQGAVNVTITGTTASNGNRNRTAG
ncbi:hypothetical protein GCM10010124_27650 [Pilimelia terevasa]|uniref:Uncharacterized protein n=1 Tax=Pilimelia terevasa TaxID=53372 RepID=A0A8J3FIF6_9ACTN|nr:hypothetical protein [Pilimelia terevasa]GGK33384.1 hypothetical protein GCM10010124_27650 [Pilimelia terevasa]